MCAVDRREFNDRDPSETLSFNLVSEFAPRPHVPDGEGTDLVPDEHKAPRCLGWEGFEPTWRRGLVGVLDAEGRGR